MEKLLNVPLISQTPGTPECGIACTKMILDYDGVVNTYDHIKKDLPIREGFGLYIYEIGTYFLKQGYSVEAVGLNTHFMHVNHIGASTADIRTDAKTTQEKRCSQPRWEKLSPGFDTLLEFIDHGGIVTAKIPTPDDIIAGIDQDRPVFAALTTNFLYGKVAGHNEHFSVLTGYTNSGFHMNDPGMLAQGEKQHFPIERIMFALHANAAPSVEGGMLLKMRPPQ